MIQLEFLREGLDSYWNKRAFLFESSLNLSDQLLGVGSFLDKLNGRFSDGYWEGGVAVPVNASRISEAGKFEQFLNIDINFARDLYHQGYSLCFGDISEAIEEIQHLKNSAGEIFGFSELIVVTAYLSPPNSVGVLHYDRQHNFFIQKSGSKKWFVSTRAGLANPHHNLVYSGISASDIRSLEEHGCEISLPKDCGVTEFTLHEGGVLYLPPGFYHSPETLDCASFHFTLTLEPACIWRDIQKELDVLRGAKDRSLYQDYRALDQLGRRRLKQHCLKLVKERLSKL